MKLELSSVWDEHFRLTGRGECYPIIMPLECRRTLDGVRCLFSEGVFVDGVLHEIMGVERYAINAEFFRTGEPVSLLLKRIGSPTER